MRITTNFQKYEFDCKDGSKMPKEVFSNVLVLAEQLQVLRDYIDRPITLNSAYRSVKHNNSIPGASKKSQHLLGKAADIRVNNIKPEQLAIIVERLIDSGEMMQGGIGIYNTFLHYDIRGQKARWDYRK